MFSPKLIPLSRASSVALSLKKSDARIVFTNGCFDILHAGHIHYLKQAKEHGSILWVGLNSDSSVRINKGDTRPINPEKARAFVLSELACVDYITLFSDTTPHTCIRAIKPHIHVKGGDYKKETLPEYSEVVKHGGSVLILPFIDGFSTSSILSKLTP